MGFKCCISGCKSYSKNETIKKKISFHSFPFNNQELLLKWKQNLSSDFVPNATSKVCSLHFNEADFFPEGDSNKCRQKQKGHKFKRKLNRNAVPKVISESSAFISSDIPPCTDEKITTLSDLLAKYGKCGKDNDTGFHYIG